MFNKTNVINTTNKIGGSNEQRFNAAAGGFFSLDLNGEPNDCNFVVIGKAGTGKVISQSFLANVVLKADINKMKKDKL